MGTTTGRPRAQVVVVGRTDSRVTRDGAYSLALTGLKPRLYRCIGERLDDKQTRFGYEDILTGTVEWRLPGAPFIRRLQFVKQGDISTAREIVDRA